MLSGDSLCPLLAHTPSQVLALSRFLVSNLQAFLDNCLLGL